MEIWVVAISQEQIRSNQDINLFCIFHRYIYPNQSYVCIFLEDQKESKQLQQTYQPPYGIDSAIAGYIWKGRLTDKDVLSLIYYWADKGYIKIYELGRDDMELMKLQDLPNDAPEYQKIMFQKLFEENPYRVDFFPLLK